MTYGSGAGILIAVDGIDGAGKTTQVGRICDALISAGEVVVASKEPTNGEHGRRLRESARTGRLSPDEELKTFVADRREHVATVIMPALAQGHVVLLDRYFYSTLAYQGARTGQDPCQLYELMREFPTPDIAFLVDVLPEVGLHRIAELRGEIPNEFERLEALREIRSLFLQLETCAPEICHIDGNARVEVVYHDIIHQLLNVLQRKRCVKPYQCDMLFCSYRQTGECVWPAERAKLLASADS